LLPAPSSTSGESSSEQDVIEPPEEMLAIVGDLMRSISLVQFYPQHNTLEEIARDFNANWTCAVEMLNDNVYLGAENWCNIFCLRRNTSSSNEEIRCRLDTIGEYHLGEMCNKFMSGSLIMPVLSKGTASAVANCNSIGSSASNNRRHVRRSGSPQKNNGTPIDKQSSKQHYRPVVATGSQTLFGTVDGTLGVILGLDQRTLTFFTSLERAMANIIEHVGNFPHGQYRACHAERRIHPAHGFIDGDFIERFLDLHRLGMEMIVEEMNRDGSWNVESINKVASIDGGLGHTSNNNTTNDSNNDRFVLTVEDVMAMVEEMSMLH
jgi:DNA damage-binding protein 1